MAYQICVTLKSGNKESENEIHIGLPPKILDEIEVNTKADGGLKRGWFHRIRHRASMTVRNYRDDWRG